MRFAIAHINFFDNELTIEIHEGDSWQEAAAQHSKIGDFANDYDDTDLNKAKSDAFDQDMMIDVKVIE